MSIALCLPPPPPTPPHLQILHRLLFSNPLGRTVYSQKDMKTIPYTKFAGQTECIMEDSKEVSGKKVRAHPLHLFLIILLYRAMLPWDFFGRVQTRALESKKPPSYLHQKDRTLIKRVLLLRFFILLFCKICFLYLTVTPSASRSLSM